MCVLVGRVGVEILVDGVELNAPLPAPFDGIGEKLALAHAPKDKFVPVFHELAERGRGKGDFLAYFRVTVFDNSAVKIYCNGHVCMYGCRDVKRRKGLFECT